MTGVLNVLASSGLARTVQFVGQVSRYPGQTQYIGLPSGAQVGDLAIFYSASSNGANKTTQPGAASAGWNVINEDSGSSVLTAYWKIVTAADFNNTSSVTSQCVYIVYRGPVNAASRSIFGFTRSVSSVGLAVGMVKGNLSDVPGGCSYNTYPAPGGDDPTLHVFDNFAPLGPYASGTRVISSGDGVAIELLSA